MRASPSRLALDQEAASRRRAVEAALVAAFASGDGHKITRAVIHREEVEQLIALRYHNLELKKKSGVKA